MAFDSHRAVLIHNHGPSRGLQPSIIGLQDEENLLIHRCRIDATRQKERLLDHEGVLFLRADFDAVLTWSVQATVLTFDGLPNYHPGTPLARQALAFAQQNRTPHQYLREADGDEIGLLYYEDPSTDTIGGDTPETSFQIVLEFSDLDTSLHPGESGQDDPVVFVASPIPDAPVAAVEIPAQASAPLPAAALSALASAVAHRITGPYAGAFTATLFDGDPATVGTAISDPLTMAAWENFTQPDTPDTTVARNHAALTWPYAAAARSISHIRLQRGTLIRDIALASPVAVPAYVDVTAPVDALGIHLTWALDGNFATDAFDTPATISLQYLMGTETLQPAGTTAFVECYDGDPMDAGALVGDNDLTIPRDATGLTVSGATITQAADVTGTDTAPGGGWSITHVVLGIPIVQTHFIVVELGTPIAVAPGATITIPAGTLTVTPAAV